MLPLLPTDSMSLAHRADYAAVGHPLYWLAAGWLHQLKYRENVSSPVQEGSVIFPTEAFVADDLPGDFLTGSTTIVSVAPAKFVREMLPASFSKPPYLDFRGDLRVYNAKSHDLYPIAGVSSFAQAFTWLLAPGPTATSALMVLPHRVTFPASDRTPHGY